MKAKKLHLFEFNCLMYFLIRTSFIGILANNLLMIAKQDSWISTIIGMILGFIPLLIYYFIMRIDPNENIFGIIKKVFGRTIGYIINIIIIIFIMIFAVIIFWDLINFVSFHYLDKTSQLVIALLFSVCIYYMFTKNIFIIGRIAVTMFYISLLLMLVSILGLIFQVDFSNIKPVLEFGINPVIKGSIQFISYSVLPLFLLTVIPLKSIKKNRNFIKGSISIYLFTCLVILLTIILVLSIYGIEMAKIMPFPEFQLLKKIALLNLVGRFESIIAIHWIFDLVMFISLCLYFIKNGTNQLFKISFNKIINIIIVILLISGWYLFFNNIIIGNSFLINIFPAITFFILLGIPTLILIIYQLKRYLL